MKHNRALQLLSDVILHYSLCGSRSLQDHNEISESDISDDELDQLEKFFYGIKESGIAPPMGKNDKKT